MKRARFATSVLAAIATIAIGASGAVTAEEAAELKGRSVKVTLEDLDLEKESGAHTAYYRLVHASKLACGVELSKKMKSAAARSDSTRCYRDVLTASVKEVDSALVTRIHEGN